jgi:hypothetical protein
MRQYTTLRTPPIAWATSPCLPPHLCPSPVHPCPIPGHFSSPCLRDSVVSLPFLRLLPPSKSPTPPAVPTYKNHPHPTRAPACYPSAHFGPLRAKLRQLRPLQATKAQRRHPQHAAFAPASGARRPSGCCFGGPGRGRLRSPWGTGLANSGRASSSVGTSTGPAPAGSGSSTAMSGHADGGAAPYSFPTLCASRQAASERER